MRWGKGPAMHYSISARAGVPPPAFTPALGLERDAGLLVLARPHAVLVEDFALRDPLEGLLEHLARVGLEHDALARTPAPRVDLGVEARGELLAVVVGVELGAQVDVALRAAQRAEVLLHVLRVRIAGEHRGHHEGGVDHLA